jgi:hypothetical protein
MHLEIILRQGLKHQQDQNLQVQEARMLHHEIILRLDQNLQVQEVKAEALEVILQVQILAEVLVVEDHLAQVEEDKTVNHLKLL